MDVHISKEGLLIAIAAMAFLAWTGCGSDSETKTVVKTVTEPPAVTTEQTEAETEPEDDSCEAKGINPEKLKTGTCTDDQGRTAVVVNKADTLQLKELSVTMNGFTTAETLGGEFDDPVSASGVFVVFDLTVTNKLDMPASFDQDQDQVVLALGNANYTESFEAENGPVEDSCLFKEPSDIQPGTSKSCKVVFDVSAKHGQNVAAKSLKGNLNVLNFSDSAEESFNRYGTIRLYN